MEQLRIAMEVDALVVVCTETRSTNKTVGVAKIDLFVWGHNPVPMPMARARQTSRILDRGTATS
jgi:hypothetical protein